MKEWLLSAAFSVMLAAPALAQPPTAPAQTPPQPAAPQAPAQAAPQPPRPFPEGAKIAYINVQRIANDSAEGKQATAKVQALNEKKVGELNQKNTALQGLQQKLQQSGAVMSDTARIQLEKDIEKAQVEIQRFTQDAQAEVRDLQEDLQDEFQRKLMPVIVEVATEKGLHMVFSQQDAGLVWADTGLDITNDVIKRFDALAGAAAAPASGVPATARP
jgi:outer membrane protein